jgi:hypothetical protein
VADEPGEGVVAPKTLQEEMKAARFSVSP